MMPIHPVATKFVFRAQALKDLWDKELAGQMSDGLYENSWRGSHFYDYIFYTDAKTSLGEKTKLIGLPRWATKRYGYSRLIPVIGDRMLDIMRETMPDATKKDLKEALQEISLAVKTA